MAVTNKHVASFNSSQKFSRAEVLFLLKHFVYPPCALEPDDIRLHHKLVDDLGYSGNARQMLASKTNNTFGLQAPNRFTGPEMMKLNTVAEHHTSTCAKLKKAGRLKT